MECKRTDSQEMFKPEQKSANGMKREEVNNKERE